MVCNISKAGLVSKWARKEPAVSLRGSLKYDPKVCCIFRADTVGREVSSS